MIYAEVFALNLMKKMLLIFVSEFGCQIKTIVEKRITLLTCSKIILIVASSTMLLPYWRVIRHMRLYFHRKEICAYT